MKSVILLILTILFMPNEPQKATVFGRITDKEANEGLINAKIVIKNTPFAVLTDLDGYYFITNLPFGNYEMEISYLGFKSILRKVKINSDSLELNFQLEVSTENLETVFVYAKKEAIRKSETNARSLQNQSNYLSGASASMQLISDYNEKHNTDDYSYISENKFKTAGEYPVSTFSIDVDNASYSNVRQMIQKGILPYKDAVRVEEFINYFDYHYLKPQGNDAFAISTEYSENPWNRNHRLISIGIQGKKIEKKHENILTFLIDVSGSMSDENKLGLLIKSMELLVKTLDENDKIAIVVYAGSAGLVLEPTEVKERKKIIDALSRLSAGGSTAGGEGIQLAYAVARSIYKKSANNRIILATDGDFNVGISSTSELSRYIESQRKYNIYLTILGLGMGNYKDNRLKEFSKKGNGNYFFIDSFREAKKIFLHQLQSTIVSIANDVKIQVEFNPSIVESYRLVGYENRLLNKEDFENDTIDAGEIGSDHNVTALYEIKVHETIQNQIKNNSKYTEQFIKSNEVSENELLTINVRYKEIDSKQSKLISKTIIKTDFRSSNQTSNSFKLAATVAEFALILRDSEFKGNASIQDILKNKHLLSQDDKLEIKSEFFNLVERYSKINKRD